MEQQQSVQLSSMHNRCFCCMTQSDEIHLRTHLINSIALRQTFQTDHLKLCYICKKVAEHADQFVQNVIKNQLFLHSVNMENDSEFNFESVQPIHSLTQVISILQDPIGNNEMGMEHFLVKDEPQNTDFYTERNENDRVNRKSFIEQNLVIKFERNEPKEEVMEPVEEGSSNIIFELLENDYGNEAHRESLNKAISDDEDIDTLNNVVCQLGDDDEANDDFSYPEKKSDEVKLEPVKVPKPDVFFITLEECQKERDEKVLATSYSNSPFKCIHCILGFRMKTSLEKHMKKHEDEGQFQCEICLLHFTTPAKLQTHMPNHLRRYKCKECEFINKSSVEMKDHYLKVHCNGARAYTCSVCYETSTTYRNHRYHLLKHKTKFKCPYCLGLYGTANTLNGHMRRKHPKEVGYKPVSTIQLYKCDECGREMSTENGLYKHKKLHEKKLERREYLCVECNKSFETETGLKCHLKYTKIHSLGVICDYCNKEFSAKHKLISHIQCHVGYYNQFNCHICGKIFHNKNYMKKHIQRQHREHTPPRDKFCPICGKGFMDNHQMKTHLRIHTGEKPYSCTKCPAKFAHNGALYNHNKLVHLGLRRDGTTKTRTRKKRQ